MLVIAHSPKAIARDGFVGFPAPVVTWTPWHPVTPRVPWRSQEFLRGCGPVTLAGWMVVSCGEMATAVRMGIRA